MQFGGTPKHNFKRRDRRLRLISNISIETYPHGLMLYNDPPTANITLQEFETFAYERVKVLHYLDSLAVTAVKNSQDYNDKLTEFLRKSYPGFLKTTNCESEVSEVELEWRKRDHISHFILRLAYCRSEELRRWFLEKELDLFKFRFLREGVSSIQDFLHLNKLFYSPISEEVKLRLLSSLSKVTHEMTEAAVEKSNFYRVPFEEVLNLVSGRRVFLLDGDAYVPQKEFLSIISTQFREHLSKALTLTSRSLPQLEEDDRLLAILRSFNQNALSTAYDPKKNEGNVSINDLDELSTTSFPLCMRETHRALKDVHHLRHWGRMQYGLFLKGIGVTLEDSLKFWRQELGKGIGVDKFEKEYAYNIRHNYGKEGKRTNYTPYSCMTVITKNPPAAQDHHGCPFKHTSPDLLRQKLKSYKTSNDTIEKIVELVKGQHFQIACQKYFESTHKLDDSAFQVTHPNNYFDESQRILKGELPRVRGSNRNKQEPGYNPTWSTPLKKDHENEVVKKMPLEELDDAELDHMMLQYSEAAE